MNKDIRVILKFIETEYQGNIEAESRHYLDINLAGKAGELGLTQAGAVFKNVYAIVPLKRPTAGMKVRIDGRTFTNYAQFESGLVVPGYIAEQANLPHKTYTAKDSMIYNFA